MERKLIYCSMCPCKFLTNNDLYYHTKAYGTNPDKHKANFERTVKTGQRQKRWRKR